MPRRTFVCCDCDQWKGAQYEASPELAERTLSQFDAQALPEDHPSLPELNRLFGEHTFFVDEIGLNIVVPVEGR